MQISSLQFPVLLVTLTLYNHFNENSSSYSFKSVDSWTSDMPPLNRYANKFIHVVYPWILKLFTERKVAGNSKTLDASPWTGHKDIGSRIISR